MRIEIRTYDGYMKVCDSGNTEVVAAWFNDQAKYLMGVSAAKMPYQLSIWPSDQREEAILSGPARLKATHSDFSAKGLLALAEAMTEAAARAKALEDR